MEPYQTGGSMIRTVSFEETTWADVPDRFEGGTPNIAGVIGLATAVKWLMGQDREAIERHEAGLARYAFDNLGQIPGIRLHGTPDQNIGIASFSFADLHAHDLGTILDREGVAIRAGHHCCMPLMKRLGVAATARASFGIYSVKSDVDALVSAVRKAKEIFA
jgi:cysteine desulfurase/selenocysteine lyase